jgi:hypothetical protein
MAKMYPNKILAGTQSNAERKVYFALQDNLPDTFTVFHSVPLLVRDPKANALLPKEIDFLVCHPSHGLLVIEVKGGGIGCDDVRGMWFSTSSDGKVHEIKNPYGQAKGALFALRDELKECGIGKRNCFPIAHAVWFPDVELGNVSLGHSANYPDITFDSTTLATPKDSVLHVLQKCQIWTAPKPPGHEGLQALVNYLSPKWQLFTRLGTTLCEEEKALFEATRSQYKVLSMLGRKSRALICGPAGSGKTFLALEKACALAKAGNDVLLLCFNQRLAEWLRTQCVQKENISIYHYHGLCSHFCQRAGVPLPTPDPLSDPKAFFAVSLPEALLDAISATDRRFDAVIVDEGQDFESLWWISIQELLKKPTHGPLYIFYDDNQQIYSTHLEFPIKEDPFLLCENCRNTQQIHVEVMKFYRGNPDTTCLGPKGRPPQIVRVADDDEERSVVFDLINRLVKQENVPTHHIMILTPKAQGKSKWREGDRFAGFPVTWKSTGNNQVIGCSTIHAFKGLESPVVILTEMFGVDGNLLRQLEYVGYSRAKSHLILIRRDES